MKPYYADESVSLYHGRFEDVLPELNVTADLILTDPPYGETSLAWDRWPKGWPSIAAEHSRSLWCFGSMRMFLSQRDEFAAWKFSQDIVWRKHNGSGPTQPDRFMRVHEHGVHWYRGEWATIHHDQQRILRAGPSKGSLATNLSVGHRGEYKPRTWTDDGTRAVPSVIDGRSMHQQGAINETQKPIGLVEPLVAYGCPPGGLVLDLFAGSASTLVAARNLGRRAIGIEMREEQCESAARRLSQGVLTFEEPA